ncbi:MAG: hypothetical protein UX79_C0017G0005 [candidate division WWE3 bacterium GW2011_GWB1_47_11]|uniref:Uncharacterized protein n=1 Tax=candidate division WWE3 bacterium GW2011_GWB1_47_11 TaxID=1619117 RepID=A0A0G1RJC6_UNCKA|nr:MAG: hypothetical protein UX79_C0017G0005 [candidate division WWE3 bacterium GW2011_GWB1_47_11]
MPKSAARIVWVMFDEVRAPGATVTPTTYVLRVIGGGGYIMQDGDVTMILANAKPFQGPHADAFEEAKSFVAEFDGINLSE